MRGPGCLAGLVIAAGLAGLAPRAAAADPTAAAAIERARQQVLDERYQPELPRGGDIAGAAAKPGRHAGGELDARDRGAAIDARAHDAAGGSPVASFALWGLVVVLGVLGALWLAGELSGYGGDAELAPDADADRRQARTVALLERPLGDADELARRGEFAEAIHTLLLRTLHALAQGAAVRLAPATTSREVLACVPLLAEPRAALAGLITAVEITRFGDAPASAADYDRCRRQFHLFTAALRGAGRDGALPA